MQGKPVPAVRQTTKGKYIKKGAIIYNQYRDAVALVLKSRWRKTVKEYALLTVKVYLRPAKSTGGIPLNAGDWDNFYKTFTDACQAAGIVSNDSIILGPGPESRNYLSSNGEEYVELELIPVSNAYKKVV